MRLIAICSLLMLSACATHAPRTGALSSYDGLAADPNAVRVKVLQRKDDSQLQSVRRVHIAPTRFANPANGQWMNEQEREAVLREIDAQLCFELSERYDIALAPGMDVHKVHAVVAEVAPTGRLGSAASAVGSFFIPGPIGVRTPAGLGGLATEAELLDPRGRQLAAILWSRRATVVGTDSPSLSRVGDALQMAEPFADAAAATMTAKDRKSRPIAEPDPCSAFGPRFRPEGWLAKFATGLYVPAMSGARQANGEVKP